MIGLFLSFLYYPSVNFIDVADLTRIIVYKGKADKKKINKIIRPLFNSAFFSFWPNVKIINYYIYSKLIKKRIK